MATLNQIRGMLLEEALLALLRASGYELVESPGDDPTLVQGASGLEVRGRGEKHQIDAIADPPFRVPFLNSQRLLLEAKCYVSKSRVGLEVIRNAVGVWKDVSEWWVPAPAGEITKPRYHYTYAVASANGFSASAERYAFAQDVFLLPLDGAAALRDVLEPIRELDAHAFGAEDADKIEIELGSMRRAVRSALLDAEPLQWPDGPASVVLSQLVLAVRRVGGALVAVARGGFSLLLIPTAEDVIGRLQSRTPVEIYWDDRGWYLTAPGGRRLFDFDLPATLFELYAGAEGLSAQRALDLKQAHLTDLVAARRVGSRIDFVRLEVQQGWIEGMRRALVR